VLEVLLPLCTVWHEDCRSRAMIYGLEAIHTVRTMYCKGFSMGNADTEGDFVGIQAQGKTSICSPLVKCLCADS